MPLFTSKSLVHGGSGVPGGTQTFNASGCFTVPAGVSKLSIKGYGGTGGTGNPGNTGSTGNAGNAGNPGSTGNTGTFGAGGGGGGGGDQTCRAVYYGGGPGNPVQA